VVELAKNPTAVETGKRLFLTYCNVCHGSDGKGAKGFPNLTDNDWLYGGSLEAIKQTLTNGRQGRMPAHGEFLGAAKGHLLATYVYSLSQNDVTKTATAPAAK